MCFKLGFARSGRDVDDAGEDAPGYFFSCM